MAVHINWLSILVLCVILSCIFQQEANGAAITETTAEESAETETTTVEESAETETTTVEESAETETTTELEIVTEEPCGPCNLKGDPLLAGPQPPFETEIQDYPGLESKMNPRPDYGYLSYGGNERLQGKVAIITGGDSGIGRAVALAFAREGASIVISYLNETEDAEETKKVIEEQGRECILIPGDIGDEDHCRKIINETVKKFERIDILVNNAGYQGKMLDDSIEGMSHERVLYTFKTNVISMFDLTRFAVPHMPKGSSIINVASIQAYQPSAGIVDYAATKAAIVAFTKGLADHMLDKGIRVNCVAPGPVWTPLIVSSLSKEHIAQFAANHPIKRPAQPREVAPVFVFLAAGRDSSYITGGVFSVTGGLITA